MSIEALTRLLPALVRDTRRRGQILSSAGALVGLGAGVAGYALLREPLRVRLDRITITLPNAARHLPRQGLRILHLSDTHFRGDHWREQVKIDSVRRACAGLAYDLLVHTGDFLHYDSGLPNVLALLDTLPRPRIGAYAVFGNHDYTTYSHEDMLRRAWSRFRGLDENHNGLNGYPTANSAAGTGGATPALSVNGNGAEAPRSSLARSSVILAGDLIRFGIYFANMPLDLKRTGHNDVAALETALAERNIQILHNRYIRLSNIFPQGDGLDIYLAGVDDVTEGAPDIRRALGDIPQDAPTILLSHNPDILLETGIEQVDLVLAGHTHGGQVVLPWLGAIHTQSQHLRRSEVAGYLRRGNTQVYITRGIGEGIPLRLGAAPQVTLLTIQGT